MMTLPSRYGVSLGGYKSIPKDLEWIEFTDDVGIHTELASLNLKGGQSPKSPFTFNDGCRYAGGLEVGDGTVQWGDTLPDAPVALVPFRISDSTNYLVAIRSQRLSYSIGANWTQLNGLSSGLAFDDTPYTVVAQGKLVIAMSIIDRLKMWDGDTTHSMVDLSSDAPIARFIAMMGNRMVAAGIYNGLALDPNLVAWSADGNIQNWTDADAGAGAAAVLPESGDSSGDPILGLSTCASGLLIYRQNSIVLASRTGIGSQPFRFTTIINGLGLFVGTIGAAGVSRIAKVVHAGATIGDIFLGNDLNIYLFNPPNVPVPIGEPIRKLLQANVSSLKLNPIKAVFDSRSSEYTIGTLGGICFTLDIGQFISTRRLVWRQTPSLSNMTALGYYDIPNIGAGAGIVTSPTPTNNVFRRVRPDEGTATSGPTTFTYVSRILGSEAFNTRISSIYIPYDFFLDNFGVTVISLFITPYISTDGGDTWTTLGTSSISSPTHTKGALKIPVNMRVTTWQLRLDIQPTWANTFYNTIRIPKIGYYVDRGGRV